MNKVILIVIIIFGLYINRLQAQDFVRVGLSANFRKDKPVQTFSFDLNRTEKLDEKITGRYFFHTKDDLYLLPSIDVIADLRTV